MSGNLNLIQIAVCTALLSCQIFNKSLHFLFKSFEFGDYHIFAGNKRMRKGEDRVRNNKIFLNRHTPDSYVPHRRKLLKGMAILFLVFAPFLGVCDLMEPGNGLVVAGGKRMEAARDQLHQRSATPTLNSQIQPDR